MPIGSTSKRWDPGADSKFRHQRSQDEDSGLSSSMSSTQWRPRLRAEKDMSSVAGDTSEGSTAAPRLGTIEELDEEALGGLRMRQFGGVKGSVDVLERHSPKLPNCLTIRVEGVS